MFALQKYQNKKVAVYGMGITGYSAAKAFRKLKAEVYCWDDNKKVRKKIKNSKFSLNKFWLNQNLVDIIVISPGIDINKSKIKNYLKKNSNKIITDLDLFFEFNKEFNHGVFNENPITEMFDQDNILLPLKSGKHHNIDISLHKNNVERVDSWYWRIPEESSFFSLKVKSKKTLNVPITHSNLVYMRF